MVKRVAITDSNKASFICPKCNKIKIVDVSKFAFMNGTAKVHAKCSCGHKWTSMLEKRKQFRKAVNFSGTYEYIKNNKVVDRGGMQLVDLSTGGAKVKLTAERDLKIGAYLNLEFHLDDKKCTMIKRRVKIQSINGTYIGTTFNSADGIGPDLGFYLMQ